MNKILKAARMARGTTADEVSASLGLTAKEYQELENQVSGITPELAQEIGSYFSIPAYYFLMSKPPDIQGRIHFLERQLSILKETVYRDIPLNVPLHLATTILELIITKEELKEATVQQLALSEDLIAITELYEYTNALYKQAAEQISMFPDNSKSGRHEQQ